MKHVVVVEEGVADAGRAENAVGRLRQLYRLAVLYIVVETVLIESRLSEERRDLGYAEGEEVSHISLDQRSCLKLARVHSGRVVGLYLGIIVVYRQIGGPLISRICGLAYRYSVPVFAEQHRHDLERLVML